jgi:hypothetical protein
MDRCDVCGNGLEVNFGFTVGHRSVCEDCYDKAVDAMGVADA